MAGFMRKIAGYDEGGPVTLNLMKAAPEPDDGTEDDIDTPKDNSLAVGMPPPRKKLIIPADYTQEKMLAALIKGTDNLSRPRTDKSEKWLAIAAALGQPTRTGTIGETASNVASAVGKFKAEQRAEEQKRLTDALGLQKGIYDIVSDAETKQAAYDQKVAAALVKNATPIGQPHYDKNGLGQTTVTAMYPGGWTVQYNLQNKDDVTIIRTPTLPGGTLPTTNPPPTPKTPPPPPSPLAVAAADKTPLPPSPLAVAAADKTPSPSPTAPSPLQAAAADTASAKTFSFQGKPYTVGQPGTDKEGRPFVMGENAIPVYTGEVPLVAKTAQAISEATGKAKGEALVAATNAWPKVQTLADEERKAIQDMRTQPGLSAIIGLGIDPSKGAFGDIKEKDPQSGETKSRARLFPSSPAADAYEAYNRVAGGVWLQGYKEALRGTGPIATKEGESAAKATATLGRKQSFNAFNKHTDEYEARVIQSTRLSQTLKGETPTYGLPPRNKAEAQPGQVFIAANGTVVKAAKDPATGNIEMYPLNDYWRAQK